MHISLGERDDGALYGCVSRSLNAHSALAAVSAVAVCVCKICGVGLRNDTRDVYSRTRECVIWEDGREERLSSWVQSGVKKMRRSVRRVEGFLLPG